MVVPISSCGRFALAVVALGLVVNPRSARAQGCTTLDPPCPPDMPPSVSIVPSAGTYTTPSVNVTVYFNDDYSLNWSTVSISQGSFNADAGNTRTGGSFSGAVQLQAGATTTLTASICDDAGNCSSASASYNYTPPPPPPPHAAPALSLAPYNGDNRDVPRCLADCFEQTLSYRTPAYVSLDVGRSVTLSYSAARVLPEATVMLDAIDGSSVAPSTMSLRVQRPDLTYVALEGLSGAPTEIFFQSGNGASRLAGRFNTGALPTGAYGYTAVVTSYWSDATLGSTIPIRVPIVNETQSPYGAGWSIVDLQRIVPQSDGVVLTGGDGSEAFFANCVSGCNTYIDPRGDFTVLTQRAGATGWDRRGPNGTVAGFDSNGRLTSRADRYGNQTSFAYNATGALASITDPAGLVTNFSYDVNGKLASITDPGGRITRVTVNAAGDLTQIFDPDGVQALQIVYDAAHLPLYTVDRVGGRYDFSRDFSGKLSQVQLPTVTANGVQVRPKRSLRAIEQQALLDGSGTGTSTNPAPRRLPEVLRAKITEPNGDSTVYAFDRFGQPTRMEFQNPQGQWRVSTATYNSDGEPTQVTTAENASISNVWSGPDLTATTDNNSGSHTDLTYEPTYHQVLTVTVDGDLTQQNFYGALGRLDSTKAGTSKTTYTYDGRGRVLTVTDPLGHQASSSYDATGVQNTHSVTKLGPSGGASTTTYGYDAFGRLQSTTDPTGRVVTMAYDAINRPTSTTGPLNTTTQSGYNDATRTYTVTDAKGQVYQDTRNALGWVETATDPRGGVTRLAYDSSGNVISSTNRRGGVVTSTYDARNRPVTVSADGHTTTFTYDPLGYWVAVSDEESVDTLKMDAKHRVTDAITWRNGVRYDLQPTYTPQGFRSAMTIVAPTWSRDIGYGYDALFRLNYLRNQGVQAVSLTYNLDQLLSAVGFPITVSGTTHLTENISYNPAHLPMALTYNGGPAFNLGRRYTYDALGRTATITQGTPPGDPNAEEFQNEVERTLGYDALGRLSHYDDVHNWQQDNGIVCPDPFDLTTCYRDVIPHSDLLRQQDFTYDAVGNRTDLGAVVETGNRVTAFNGYTLGYDADGNLISKTGPGFTQTLSWNGLGQLVSVTTNGTTTTFGYDGFGRRVRKTTGTTTSRYLWDGNDLLMDLDGSGNPLREYSYYPGIDRPFAVRRSSDGAVFYYGEERPGQVAGLISTSDQVVNAYTYSPWGEAISTTEQVPQSLRYAGREYDPETGFYSFRARYYDPQLGRFISEDPIGLTGGINPFAYVANDPVNRRDPTGQGCYYLVLISYYVDTGEIFDAQIIGGPYCDDFGDEGGGIGGGGGGDQGGGAEPQGPDPRVTGVCRQPTYAGEIIVDASIAARAASFINDAVLAGARVTVTSSFRTTSEQWGLWLDRYVWGTKTDYPVAFPGTSNHEAGFSLDISWKNLDAYSRNAILQAADQFGFVQDPGDRVHFSNASGFGPYQSRSDAIKANQTAAEQGIPACGP